MTIDEAEAQFRELQAQIEQGQTMSRPEFERHVAELVVQDECGVFWQINPRTSKRMYFDGADWIGGTPPGHDHSTVMPRANIFSSAAAPRPATTERAPATRPIRTSADRVPPSSPTDTRHLEWVPFAFGALALFFCAVLVFFGGHWVVSAVSSTSTATLVVHMPSPTYTPVPTLASLPNVGQVATEPRVLANPAPVLAKVIENRVNVRAAPNTQAKIISGVRRNQTLALVARSSDSQWYQIKISGAPEPGWIFAQTLQIESGDINGLPIIKTP